MHRSSSNTIIIPTHAPAVLTLIPDNSRGRFSRHGTPAGALEALMEWSTAVVVRNLLRHVAGLHDDAVRATAAGSNYIWYDTRSKVLLWEGRKRLVGIRAFHSFGLSK